jgi:AcrR family transcriptional regulator
MKVTNSVPYETPVAYRIFDAYIALTARNGLGRVPLQKCSKFSKVPYSTVFYHFGKGNADLFEEAMTYALSRAQRSILELWGPKKRRTHSLSAYFSSTFQWIELEPEMAAFCLLSHYSKRKDIFPSRKWLDQALLETIAQGAIPPQKSKAMKLLSTSIYALLLGYTRLLLGEKNVSLRLELRKSALRNLKTYGGMVRT